jgi:sterol desaturase/sphingolipid hydroxylase (fatty acid hydroxylase superfamily)
MLHSGVTLYFRGQDQSIGRLRQKSNVISIIEIGEPFPTNANTRLTLLYGLFHDIVHWVEEQVWIHSVLSHSAIHLNHSEVTPSMWTALSMSVNKIRISPTGGTLYLYKNGG